MQIDWELRGTFNRLVVVLLVVLRWRNLYFRLDGFLAVFVFWYEVVVLNVVGTAVVLVLGFDGFLQGGVVGVDGLWCRWYWGFVRWYSVDDGVEAVFAVDCVVYGSDGTIGL